MTCVGGGMCVYVRVWWLYVCVRTYACGGGGMCVYVRVWWWWCYVCGQHLRTTF